MNVTPYTLDSLRKLVRDLQAENKELKALLDKSGIPYAKSNVFEESGTAAEEYDIDQGGRIQPQYIDQNLAVRFFSMFWGREDVFAKRARNGNYYPQCENRWNAVCPAQAGSRLKCGECEYTKWQPLGPDLILRHLLGYKEDGSDVIGVYPLLPDGKCRFLVFDFDNHEKGAEKNDFANEDEEWHDEVDALRLICQQNCIDALVERSRSGRGAHVWIFFMKPIEAATARNFGFLLLDKGRMAINLKSFRFYDRMYPSQDFSDSIGNLVALPLQGQALKAGNSAFVDENWNAYPNQWKKLLGTQKLSLEEVEQYIAKWQGELFAGQMGPDYAREKNRSKPWKRQDDFQKSDVDGKLHIVLAEGVYVDALNLKPRLQNQIRCLAAFDNPVFYKNKRLGYSNYYHFSMVYMGEDVDGYIKIPRGLLEALLIKCRKAELPFTITDQRENGRPIHVTFHGELRMQQDLAVQQLLSYDNGILSAATAFGKTVVCSYLIAQRKVNTLILLESKDLLLQWQQELERFLDIEEEPPDYHTKSGRVKKRDSVIGVLRGGKDTLTGIVDIAMVGSLYKKGAFHEKLNTYGMVIMDECHHAASVTAQEILKKVNAKYVYGVSATPMRSDSLEKINEMLLGPIRHKYTAKERTEEQGIEYLVIPRYTRVINTAENKKDINAAYALISAHTARNEQIIEDVQECVSRGRTPVILTRYKEQAKTLYEKVKQSAQHVFLLYGDNSDKENEKIRKELMEVPAEETMILVATGQKVGEGFDCPRLDTLMLAAPVSYQGRLEQYVGRLSRNYEGKTQVIVYDYIDSHIFQFDRMYLKRLRTYKKIGFQILTNEPQKKQEVNAIYDAGNYTAVFERDLVEAEKEIIVSSPQITQDKIERFLYLIKPQGEAGVKVTVITEDPENSAYENAGFLYALTEDMKHAGIHVKIADTEMECFAVIDQSLVWHGGMNLLGKQDAYDNLIRVRDAKAVEELLLIAEKADIEENAIQ